MKKYLMGIDVGTSNVKAVLFDDTGHETTYASRENITYTSAANGAEQDMEEVYQHVKSCVVQLVKEYPDECRELAGIGVTGQGEGFWAIDRDGKPLQRALLWRDGRAVDEVEKITKKNPEIGRLYHTMTGTPPLTGNQLILTSWMKNNRPEVLDRVWKVFFCKDWIRYRMTGEICADLTDSMTCLLDTDTYEKAYPLYEAMGLGEYGDIFPDPIPSDQVAGRISKTFAQETGLREGIPVIAGALDTSATMIGLGAVRAGSAAVILGTTCACETVFNKEDCRFGHGFSRYEKHPAGDLFVDLQPTNNGTTNIDWMLDCISTTRNFNEIDSIVESAKVGSSGVIYLPYIGLAGERAPFYHPYARAEFFGMSQVTTRADMVRAVYEGISLSIKDCFEEIGRIENVYLAGGGARSPVWSQMIADVLGSKVSVPSGDEQGAKGAALMAGISQGIYAGYEEAVAAACSFRHTYEPRTEMMERYDLLYTLFKKLRMNNDEVWNMRHNINKELKRRAAAEGRDK